jgi:hypothetical protein
MLQKLDPERAKALLAKAEAEVKRHFTLYEQLSRLKMAESAAETLDK